MNMASDANTGYSAADAEVERFESLAGSWWDAQGEFKLLHQVNPIRLRHVASQAGPLKGKRIADIGCGGGLFSEALAGEGADVVGIDLSKGAVSAARSHMAESGLEIEYRVASIEDLVRDEDSGFDVVVCLEMLEHVPDPAAVVGNISRLLVDGGCAVLSTINRTVKAYLLMIAVLEGVLRVMPRGTHDHAKFIPPEDLSVWCRSAGLKVTDVTGLKYSPFGKLYYLDRGDASVNYFLTAKNGT